MQLRGAIILFTCGLTTTSAWAGSENLRNFLKVDDHVYRGAQPTDSGFQELAKLGIKTIVDLRDIGEHSQADEQKIVSSLGMRYVSIPMREMATPKEEQVAAVLGLLNDASSGPVFVHCKRGADRTGTMIAIYRVAHDGWANLKALSEAKSDGMSIFQRALMHYITSYKPSVAGATAAVAALN